MYTFVISLNIPQHTPVLKELRSILYSVVDSTRVNVFVMSDNILCVRKCAACAPIPDCFVDIYVPYFGNTIIISTFLCLLLSYLYSSGLFMSLLRNTLNPIPYFGLVSKVGYIFLLDSV